MAYRDGRDATKRHGRSSCDALSGQPARFTVSRQRYRIRNITILPIPIDNTQDNDQGSADMAVTQAIPMTRHPYADGSYKKMLIDGK
jgi:hypothetical protein